MKVEGIGTVELQTERSPDRTGSDNHGVLRLTNVLHVPSSLSNILGGPLLKEYRLDFKGDTVPIKDSQGQPIAFLCQGPLGLLVVKLHGPPVGITAFDEGKMYYVNALWADSERQKWINFQATNIDQDGYTPEEREWLKGTYGNEFDFLRSMGLSILKEEDRGEGRAILRSLMRDNGEKPKSPTEREVDF